MGSVTGKINLPGETDRIWGYITDPAHFPEWIDGYAEGRVLTPHATGLGAEYEWYGRFGPIKLKSVEKIVEWQEGERVAYEGRLARITFNSFMELRAIGGRKTQLEIGIIYTFPVIYGGPVVDAIAFERMFQKYGNRSLERLSRIFAK